MLASEPGRDLSRAVLQPLAATQPEALNNIFAILEAEAEEQLRAEGARGLTHERLLELRYHGQSAALHLPGGELEPGALEEAFHRAHERSSGHRLPLPVELVNLRLRSRGAAPLRGLSPAGGQVQPKAAETFNAPGEGAVSLLRREDLTPCARLQGPLVVQETAATCWVARGWTLTMDEWGNLRLQQSS
jgi:N-methylhydantoinase A